MQQGSEEVLIQLQPMDVDDFSGGLTDNWFDDGPNRYAAADNFLITVDRKLAQRPGTITFDSVNYALGSRRIDALRTFINETKILGFQSRDAYYIPDVGVSPVWTRLTGPSGNEALGAGSPYTQYSQGEYNHQMWVTNTDQPIPSRIYRDQNLAYQVRTAGLPRARSQNPMNDSLLLGLCIANANTLRASMVAHLNDNAGLNFVTVPSPWNSGPNLHTGLDKWTMSYFSSQNFTPSDFEYPGPSPVPTPAPAATNQITLFALVAALQNAYNHHAFSGGTYHNSLTDTITKNYGPLATLNSSATPTTLYQAAGILDDLLQKWFFHQWAINMHGGVYNDISLMSRYNTTVSKIGTIYYDTVNQIYLPVVATITPNYQDFYNYVNGLIIMHNNHVMGGGATNLNGKFTAPEWIGYHPTPTVFTTFNNSANSNPHTQPDVKSYCGLPLVTSLDQAYLAIYWLRELYTEHKQDISGATATTANSTIIKFTSTAGSPNITSVIDNASTLAITIPLGSYVVINDGGGTDIFGGAGKGFNRIAKVIANGSGTATLDRIVIGSLTAQLAINTTNSFHAFFSASQVSGTETIPTAEILTSAVTAFGTDIISWLALGAEYMYCLINHTTNATEHEIGGTLSEISFFNPTEMYSVQQWYLPTISQVSYGFTYYYPYTVEPNGLQFINESNPVFSASFNVVEPLYAGYSVPATNITGFSVTGTTIVNTYPTAISLIPSVVNDATTNYDTANIIVRIYRTTNGGNTFYLLDTVNNGVRTYSDITNDTIPAPGTTALNLRQVLYTSGGVVGNDQPPQCRCMHVLNGTAYYGNIIDTTQYFPNVIRQSLPQNPDSAPATFTDTMEDEVIGISSCRSTVVVLCKNSIYRLNGGFSSSGTGAISHERISDAIGCISAHSIVRTEIGIFFAGTDGFYYTDGFQLIKISIDLNQTYKNNTQNAAQKARIQGAYDKTTRRIYWTMQQNPSDIDVDKIFIFYLDYGVKPGGVYTTISNDCSLVPNAVYAQYFRPSSVVFYQGQLIKGDLNGVIVKTDPYCKTDPKIDLTTGAANWNTIAMPFTYTSCSLDEGTHAKRKYAVKIQFLGKNVGNTQVLITANSDNGRIVRPLSPINYTFNTMWGDARYPWTYPGSGLEPLAWDYRGKVDSWRRFPRNSLRANLRQVSFTNARIGVYRSEDFPLGCTASIATSLHVGTITIATPSGYTAIVWPLDCVDYYIAFQGDGYVQEWLVTAVSTNTLTVADPSSLLVNGQTGLGWVLRGYKKSTSVEISAYVIKYGMLGDKTQAYGSGADSGENT